MRLWLLVAIVSTLVVPATAVGADGCGSPPLLAAGVDSNGQPGIWRISLDDQSLQQLDPGTDRRSYLVAVSPDEHWLLMYQADNSYNPATDRFVVDTVVMDLATDERFTLLPGSAPLGWTADSSAVVQSEHPNLMTRVPGGEVVPSAGTLVYPRSMRGETSPDGRLAAVIEKTPDGAAGISILDVSSNSEVMHIPTGRGAPQLAWSPDSTRLAFTSGTDTPAGMLWQLRIADMTSQTVELLGATQDLRLHSVVWLPSAPACDNLGRVRIGESG